MRLNNCLFILFGLFSTVGYAQDIAIDSHKEELQSSMISYIETLNDRLAAELDSIREYVDPSIANDDEDVQIFKRLKSIIKTIPLAYNSQVREYIDKYTSSNYRPYMRSLLSLSRHYFAIYEQVFEGAGIPEEVKYLSLVESSLNPHLVSRSGAVGPWQFMYATARMYDLDMNSYVDERKDVYASSYAVTRYLTEAYDQFNDWLLAIASYNCGRGCVQRAIQRSGLSSPSFWELSPYLPQETRNYVPKYIAMTYVMEMADFYAIYPVETDLDLEHEVLMVDRVVDLNHIAQAIDIPIERLKKYNPAYKHTIVNGTAEKPKRLLLPLTDHVNDSLLYVALHNGNSAEVDVIARETTKQYRVSRHETIYDVAKKFGVSVQNLRAWNGLTAKSTVSGKTLLVDQPISERLASNISKVASNNGSSSQIAYYTVRRGDSLDRIAKKYRGVSVSKLKADNNLKSNLIKPGMRLKITKQ
ncbi:LysM peptidoglycan-binding domain-containing protein [Sphingobacterium sp. SGG-5]|uniref:lytic transglycosylase domain-containing protein n=1 Tax=Sphingobacterium sp. SGG-5 TaxID=2710881 RepID=UPI0013EA11F5|nr:lytic transglycosylase domain-containing protein [Sphingobacterium sp. SGG-5]NGM62890.1 LysM peptidoglycan-binding domain-containing protein [Sphingobacterium sp. SGG-5]